MNSINRGNSLEDLSNTKIKEKINRFNSNSKNSSNRAPPPLVLRKSNRNSVKALCKSYGEQINAINGASSLNCNENLVNRRKTDEIRYEKQNDSNELPLNINVEQKVSGLEDKKKETVTKIDPPQEGSISGTEVSTLKRHFVQKKDFIAINTSLANKKEDLRHLQSSPRSVENTEDKSKNNLNEKPFIKEGISTKEVNILQFQKTSTLKKNISEDNVDDLKCHRISETRLFQEKPPVPVRPKILREISNSKSHKVIKTDKHSVSTSCSKSTQEEDNLTKNDFQKSSPTLKCLNSQQQNESDKSKPKETFSQKLDQATNGSSLKFVKNEVDEDHTLMEDSLKKSSAESPADLQRFENDETNLQNAKMPTFSGKILSERQVFFKRAGTSGIKGYDFENHMAAFIALKLATDPQVENFNLSANDSLYESMDDIIFESQTDEGFYEKYALQLKYFNNKNATVSRESFGGSKKKSVEDKPNAQENSGKFKLLKYSKDYNKVLQKKIDPFKFVLCTNSHFKLDIRKNPLVLEDGNLTFSVNIIECDLSIKALQFYRSENENCKYYKFEIIENSAGSENNDVFNAHRLFFENFIFLPNYMRLDELEFQIEQDFRKNFWHKGNAHSNYLDFIKKWSDKEGKQVKLDKVLIKEIIAVHLLTPHVRPLDLPSLHVRPQQPQEELSEKEKLFKEAASFFKVTVINPSKFMQVDKLWQNVEIPVISTFRKDLSKYNILPRTAKNEDVELKKELLAISLWLLRKAPLVVKDHEDVRAAISFCENLDLKFILLSDKDNQENLLGEMFQNLDDVKKINDLVYQKIINTFRYIVQEKPIFLKRLIELVPSSNLAALITTDELLSLIGGTSKLIDEGEKIYIERFITRNVINPEVLKMIDFEILILISCCSKVDILKICGNFEIIIIGDINKDKDKFKQRRLENDRKIFVFENECDSDELHKVCSDENIKYHHFKLFENDKLEWIRSNSEDISLMKKYLISGYYFPESEITSHESDNNIHIICDEPGMGKTTLMENIQFKNSPKIYWTVLITAKNYSKHFQENKIGDIREFQKFYLVKANKRKTNFGKEVLKWIMKKNFVRYIWDGLDELSEENFEIVKILIETLSKSGLKQWLNSRNNLRNSLEQRYRVIARSLKRFDKEDQEKYLEKSLQRIPDELLNKQNISRFLLNHEFLEIPLQISILCKLLHENSKKYAPLLEKAFTIPDLYKYFIENQFDVYYSKKLGINYYENDAQMKKILKEKEDQISNYERLAAKKYFPEIVPENVKIIAENFLNNVSKNHDDFGIITILEHNDDVEFFHASFGEYFVASYLFKNVDDLSKVKNLIFSNDNIFSLFNIIVSSPHEPHKAVLTGNFKFLINECFKEELKIKDKAGRHALHLACASGTKYPLLKIENDFIDDRQIYWQDLKPEPSDYVECLGKLLETCNVKDFDRFGLDCFSYAYENNCFATLALLNEKLQTFEDDSKNANLYATVIYYSVKFDYHSIFDKMETVPLIYSKHFGKSLLYVAVYYDSAKCLRKILSNSNNFNYKEIVKENKEGLLDLALKKSNIDIVVILHNNGAKPSDEQRCKHIFDVRTRNKRNNTVDILNF